MSSQTVQTTNNIYITLKKGYMGYIKGIYMQLQKVARH